MSAQWPATTTSASPSRAGSRLSLGDVENGDANNTLRHGGGGGGGDDNDAAGSVVADGADDGGDGGDGGSAGVVLPCRPREVRVAPAERLTLAEALEVVHGLPSAQMAFFEVRPCLSVRAWVRYCAALCVRVAKIVVRACWRLDDVCVRASCQRVVVEDGDETK